MNRVRIIVPTSVITRADSPNTMFHATPWAACRPIDMRSAEPVRHPAGHGVDEGRLRGELGERVIGRWKVLMVEPAAQRWKQFEHLIRMIVPWAVDPREDRKDSHAAVDQSG